MNARDLIELLQDLDPDTEIRVAHQPHYPFEYSIESMVTIGDTDNQVAYLGEGDQIGYLSQEAAVALGWAEEETEQE